MSPTRFRAGSALWRWSFWLCFGFATAMALVPKPPRLPTQDFGDKFEHMLAFAVLATLAQLAFPTASRLRIGLWFCLFGAAIEVAQAIPALHRDSDVRDWLADTAVLVPVLGVPALLQRRQAARR